MAPLSGIIVPLERVPDPALAQRLVGDGVSADSARVRWLALNRRVFRATGKMTEKYNVLDPSRRAGGGEYPTQDGFGWTNGVALALSSEQLETAPVARVDFGRDAGRVSCGL